MSVFEEIKEGLNEAIALECPYKFENNGTYGIKFPQGMNWKTIQSILKIFHNMNASITFLPFVGGMEPVYIKKYSSPICPKCGGNLELREDGYEYCDSCDYNTRNN